MSDSKSQLTSRSGKKGIDKHCNGDKCNGKKIEASGWTKHKKNMGHPDDMVFEPCTGIGC